MNIKEITLADLEVVQSQHKTQQQVPPVWAGWVGWLPMVLGMGAASVVVNVLLLIFVLGMDFDCKAYPSPVDSSLCPDRAQLEPSLPGVMPGAARPRIVLAAEPNWAPYAFINPQTGANEGVGADIARGVGEMCGLDIIITHTSWGDCFIDGKVGPGLLDGHYHACMTYSHTKGLRDRQMEFSHAFLRDNKPAGLLVRLNQTTGRPEISGMSSLKGVRIVDVDGWAPTADGISFVLNTCTDPPSYFDEPRMFSGGANLPNNKALEALLTGAADAMWVYADQSENYRQAGCDPSNPARKSRFAEWDCSKWAGFGRKFAYIHTGMFEHAVNGTTLTMSKKGSGIPALINPCMERYMRTEDYYKVCQKHNLEASCFPNKYFPPQYRSASAGQWEYTTNQQTGDCSDGFCPCSF